MILVEENFQTVPIFIVTEMGTIYRKKTVCATTVSGMKKTDCVLIGNLEIRKAYAAKEEK